MEHSWGRNVFEQGLGGLGATLAARNLLVTHLKLYVTNANNGVQYLSVVVPADMQSDDPYIFQWQSMLGQNFPYLNPVPPDVPL